MRFTEAQQMQMVQARGLLIARMHTILNERKSLVAAAKVVPYLTNGAGFSSLLLHNCVLVGNFTGRGNGGY